MYLGNGGVLSKLMNQKLNVRSSTEGLLLGYDYILCYVL